MKDRKPEERKKSIRNTNIPVILSEAKDPMQAGNLYGITQSGGIRSGSGTVFELSTVK